jgi:Flp pilus assembly protein TadG
MMFCNVIKFLRDRSGNIGPIFALSLIPTVALIGSAVDYTRANNVKSSLQSALDATTLAMAQSAPSMTSDNLKTAATDYFNALFKKPDTTGVQLTVDYTTDNGPQLVMTGSTAVKTQFMNLPGFNINSISVYASSTAAWGNSRLRVALALDNTGSMAQNSKMTMLKTAAKNLIDQLAAAAKNPDDVYVSIVPFSKDVNVGTGNVNSTWLRWSGGNPSTDAWDDLNGSCSTSSATTKASCMTKGSCSLSSYNNNQSGCASHGTCSISSKTSQSACTAAGVCSKSSYTSQSSCSSHSGTWTSGVWTGATWTGAIWTPANHSAWNGCVMDRDQNHDIDNSAPDAIDTSTLFPAEQFSSCPVEMQPLSNNWATLKTKIDSMTPVGNTNTTIGLEWAWHSLTQGAPLFAPPEDTTHYTYKKVIIFLTDGDNTQNRFSSTQANIDARMTAACANAKNPASVNGGIEIYTILVLQGSAALLQNCSSNPSDHYFKITAANELVTVFDQIGTKLARLHVAK